ncbi:NmrA family protein [Halobacteriales archaeon QS_1_69_70]|nr:MAG: NmrA family protein [Halobacteriales archaeon QS_1_69_70]
MATYRRPCESPSSARPAAPAGPSSGRRSTGGTTSSRSPAHPVTGADAVVSVLGQTDSGPDDLLTVAGDHHFDAMAEADVDRFVTLVGAGVREEGESVPLAGKVVGAALRLFAREVLADAEEHVRRTRDTDLEWTVVRAPRLNDGDGTGEYRAGDIRLGFDTIDRPDVAAFILDCLEDDLYVGEMPKVGSA